MKVEAVEFIPPELEDGTLYVSLDYSTAVHLCMCGCSNQVVTPFSENDWTLTFNGTISLTPSIGNWNFDCKSHYWIKQGKIRWCQDSGTRKIHENNPVNLKNRTKKITASSLNLWQQVLSQLKRIFNFF